jgi:MFS family permease
LQYNKNSLFKVDVIIQGLNSLITGLLTPILSLLLIEKGADILQIGLLISAYSLTVVILELPTGGLSDIIGQKFVFLLSLIAKIIFVVLFVLSNNFIMFMISAIFMGISRSLWSGSLETWFINEHKKIDKEANMQPVFSKVEIFNSAGMGIGALLGGALPSVLGTWLNAHYGFGIYSVSLFAQLLLTVFLFIISLIFIKENSHERSNININFTEKIMTVFKATAEDIVKNHNILFLLLPVTCLGFTLSGIETFWQIQFKTILADSSKSWVFGLLTGSYILTGIIGNTIITHICKAFENKHKRLLFYLRLFTGALIILFAIQTTAAGFAVFYILIYLSLDLYTSPHKELYNAQINENNRSTMLSMESLALQVGAIVGSSILGLIAQYSSISWAWIFSPIILLLSSILFLKIKTIKQS